MPTHTPLHCPFGINGATTAVLYSLARGVCVERDCRHSEVFAKEWCEQMFTPRPATLHKVLGPGLLQTLRQREWDEI